MKQNNIFFGFSIAKVYVALSKREMHFWMELSE